MSIYINLKLEKCGYIVVLILFNLLVNIWICEVLVDFMCLVKDFNVDCEIYILVVIGEGEKFFFVGVDFKFFVDGDKVMVCEMVCCFGEVFEILLGFWGVLIVVINGYVMGGGLECVLVCDICIVEEQVQMVLLEVVVGLLFCVGGMQNLLWLVGEGWVKCMILCGECVNVEIVLCIGLVEEVVFKGQVWECVLVLVLQVEKQSLLFVVVSKQLIQGVCYNLLGIFLQIECEFFVDFFDIQDQKEGVNVFFEKCVLSWKNV